jgi:hypothetical protein
MLYCWVIKDIAWQEGNLCHEMGFNGRKKRDFEMMSPPFDQSNERLFSPKASLTTEYTIIQRKNESRWLEASRSTRSSGGCGSELVLL